MIAALICAVSLGLFLQFFITLSRSMLNAYRGEELSPRVREVAGLNGRAFAAHDFRRLLQFIHLCPEDGKDTGKLRTISVYYLLMTATERLLGHPLPKAGAWTHRERELCSHFAAVVLDRRIAYSRDLFSKQSASAL